MSASKIDNVAVVGAGIIGLCTAWFLQEHGVTVTVYDRIGVAAGSSWGNAGWLTPSIATPLPEPAVLKYGLKALVSPSSPVYVPPTADLRLLRFLTQFARHCTHRRWLRSMQALIPMNNLSLEAYEHLAKNGVEAPVRPADPFIAAYRTEAERRFMLEEIEQIRSAGQRVSFDVLTGSQARSLEPALSDEIGAAIRINGERFVDPPQFVNALARSVEQRGGTIVTEEVRSVTEGPGNVVINAAHPFDAVVLASGAHLNALATRFGITTIVQAGRGYSFTVSTSNLPSNPVYFPAQRVACTPLDGGLRIGGMMEFRPADAPRDPRRITALVNSASSLLAGADLEHRRDEWVGARPCTPDGLPLIGATTAQRVFAAGGHGMWGMTLGPVTGKLLAEQMLTGERPKELRPFEPTR